MSGYYIDISQFQSEPINWESYKKWSEQWDGVSRVAIRSSEGTGIEDKFYTQHRTNAEKIGMDIIIHYHYAYPQFNAARNEAAWQKHVVGTIRPHDVLMLDMEEEVSQATSQWAYDWLYAQEENYSRIPLIYASQAYVQERLQDTKLAHYGLVLARWGVSSVPPCPKPWNRYTAWQSTDNAHVPGIVGHVDLNKWML